MLHSLTGVMQFVVVTTDWWVNQPKYGTEAANQGLDVSICVN